MKLPPHGLYAITDGPRPDLVAACAAALAGGARLIQYRDKTTDQKRRHTEAAALAALCAHYSVPLIVNDDVALAAAVGAAGVHLGEHDTDLAAARVQLGADAIIGVSCYDSLERARQMAAAGTDYLAFGAFFASPSKPKAYADPSAEYRPSLTGLSKRTHPTTPALLVEARSLGLPLVAIGGITPDNGAALIEAGANFLAVISAVFGAADMRAAARRFTDLFEPKH